MKKHFILLTAALATVLSCAKQEGPVPRQDIAQEDCTLSLHFSARPTDVCETKAVNDDDPDDTVGSLDLFFYQPDGTYIEHQRFSENLDPTSWSYKKTFAHNTQLSVLALANFNQDCMKFMEKIPVNLLSGLNACMPLDKNFAKHRIPMGGSASFTLTENTESTIELWRYMWKLKIGTITADIDDDDVKAGNIQIEKISITNCCNVITPKSDESVDGAGMGNFIFGNPTSVVGSFGNVSTGFRAGYYPQSGENAMVRPTQKIPSGNLLETYFFTYYNYNYNGGETVNVDATGDLKDASSVSYPTGTGPVMASTEQGTRVASVNQCFYGLTGGAFKQESTVYMKETETAKLVISVNIAGKTNHYIIPLCSMQPCMEYNIKNITLKGMGSAICNSYPKIYAPVDLTAGYTIGEWDHNTINNIDVGYKGYTGVYEN